MASSSFIPAGTLSAPRNGTRKVSLSAGNFDLLEEERPHLSSMWSYQQSLLLSSPGDARHTDIVVKSELTSSPDFRHPRRSTVQPPTTPTLTHTNAAISASTFNTLNFKRQDVRVPVNTSASYPSTSPATRTDVYPGYPETTVSHFSLSPQHGLTQSRNRPRTSTQVFASSQDLAAHYGIPQTLPPAPSTAPRRTYPVQPTNPPPDFLSLSSNYLNMLSQKPSDNNTMAADTTNLETVSPADLQTSAVIPGPPDVDLAQMQALVDVMKASYGAPTATPDLGFGSPESNHEFLSSPLFSDTPYDDTPFDDFLSTPVMDGADMDNMYTGPVSDAYANMHLFNEMLAYPEQSYEKPTLPVPALDKMYTISPTSPLLEDFVDPSSLYPSPRLPSDRSDFPSPASTSSRRKSSATGTRKGVTPAALVSVDAPTQPRKYVMPSATSRKEVPAVFAKKRSRSQAFADEEDELAEEPLSPNATEKEQIAYKRRQNTVAARRSRRRKLLYQQELEDKLEQRTKEMHVWRTRAETLMSLLQSNDIPFSGFDD